MAQIRSKQIADFLSSVNWASVNSTDIANAADIKALVSSEIAGVNGDNSALSDALVAEITRAEGIEGGISDALSAEISLARYNENGLAADILTEQNRAEGAEETLTFNLDAEVTRAISAEGAISSNLTDEVNRATSVEGVLSGEIVTEKNRIDAILLASDADKDSFAEIVSLINGVDTTNDNAFASYALATDASIDSLEVAISGDFTSIDARALDLENALSAEISATNDDVTNLAIDITNAQNNAENYAYGIVSTEEVARIAGDNLLQGNIDALSTTVSDNYNTLDSAIFMEQGRAESVEANLNNFIESVSVELFDEVASIDTRLGAVGSSLVDSVDSLEVALTAEIDATNSDFVVVNASIDSLEVALTAEIAATDADFTSVNTRVSTEEARVNAILLAADADKDSFAEIVSLINQVDTTNDTAFASYALATDASIDSLEVALTAEINDTNSDVTRIDAALSAEISATNSDFVRVEANLSTEIADMTTYVDGEVTSLETSVGSLETAHGDRLTSLEGYIMEDVQMYVESFVGNGLEYALAHGVQDLNINLVTAFVNGHKVEVSGFAGSLIALANPGYVIDADDTVVITYQG